MKERFLGSLFLITIVMIIVINAFDGDGLTSISDYQDSLKQQEAKREERFFYDEQTMLSKSDWIIQVDTFE